MAEFAPSGHDRLERGALGSAPTHRRIELQREVLFGDALPQERQHLEERGVGDGGGALHARDLRLVLAGSEGLHLVGGGDEAVPVEQLGPGALSGPADIVGLQPDVGHGRVGQDALGGLALLGHRSDGDLDLRRRPGAFDLLGRLRPVTAVGGQQRPAAGDGQDPGRAREAGEVPDVGQRGHDEGVDLVLVERAAAGGRGGPSP